MTLDKAFGGGGRGGGSKGVWYASNFLIDFQMDRGE